MVRQWCGSIKVNVECEMVDLSPYQMKEKSPTARLLKDLSVDIARKGFIFCPFAAWPLFTRGFSIPLKYGTNPVALDNFSLMFESIDGIVANSSPPRYRFHPEPLHHESNAAIPEKPALPNIAVTVMIVEGFYHCRYLFKICHISPLGYSLKIT